jgi:LacI family transcriptional regulator
LGKRANRDDVAKLAGVSVATVSYVINNGPRPVATETRDRVLAAIKKLGYRPSSIARSLKTGNTRTIGLLVPSLLPTLFGHLVTAIENELAHRDYGLIVASSHEDFDREKHMLGALADRSIDGLLYIPMSGHSHKMVTQIFKEEIPIVFIDRYASDIAADVVMTDNIESSKMATNCLIQSGCRRILCLSFSHDATSALDRVEGHRRALRENGIPTDNSMIMVVDWPFGAGVEKPLLQYIDANGLPDGILCTVEGFLSDVIQVMRKQNIRVPDQVKIAGGFTAEFSPWQELIERPIPIVRQNFEEIARQSVEFLMDRIQGNDVPPRIVLIPGELNV